MNILVHSAMSVRLMLAVVITSNALPNLQTTASAQGETPRCPNAPFRAPSGNFVWAAYFFNYFGSNHYGIDFVDITKAFTPTTSYYFPENTKPRSPYGVDDDDAPASPTVRPNWDFPQNIIPVHSPLSGYMNAIGTLYSMPGSVLITGTLDNVWAGTVPTREVRLWLTHMSNFTGTAIYVVRPSGPINEGDLIGYQGKGNTYPTHLHIGIYPSAAPITTTGLGGDRYSVINPTMYFNAYVDGAEVLGRGLDTFGEPDAQAMPYLCRQTPVGAIEAPVWNSTIGVGATAIILGFALDRTNITQTIGISGGVDQVKLFLDGYDPTSIPTPTALGSLLGTVNVTLSRPDIAAIYGAQATNSGWSYTWNLTGVPVGRHGIYMYAHQVSSNKWRLMDVHYINVNYLSFLPLIER